MENKMNERIKEIAEQAGFTVARGWGLKDTVPEDVFIANVCVSNEMKKFGELILKETISVLQKRFMGDLNREDMEVRRCIEDVQKHFGVE
jgi:hypothetical protein